MKKSLWLATFCTLIAVGIHSYLAVHHYELQLGISSGQSLCNINETLDCDSVNSSSYSSFLGVPIATWGLTTNLALLVLLLAQLLGLSSFPERLLRYSFWLSTFIALSSIAMGVISLALLSTYCIFCLGLYFLSFVTWGSIWKAQEDPPLSSIGSDLKKLASEGKLTLIVVVAIPALAFLLHKSLLDHYGASRMGSIIRSSIAEWKSNPTIKISSSPLLSKGPEKNAARLTISEFADFTCGHCQKAAPFLHAFIKSRPDVRFEFYTFPLDGACNEAIDHQTGRSCQLSKAVFCASKSDKGWALHDLIYKNQKTINASGSVGQIDEKLMKFATQLNLNWSDLKSCIESEEAQERISQQAKDGVQANIRGTPTFFANSRQLPRGQLLPVLEAARKSSQKSP